MNWRPLGRGRWDAIVRRLDRFAAWSNPILMIVAALLLLADLSYAAALAISRMPAARPVAGEETRTAPASLAHPS